MNTIDLHVHTLVSDGAHSPEQVVALARQAGLRVVAITDHDHVAGVAPALAAAGDGLEVIPGVEISADDGDLELHILGYFIDVAHVGLNAALARSRDGRLSRAQEMVERLAELGVPISWERVQALSGGDTVGRVHVALALQEAGHVATVSEAFDRYLADDRPGYVPRPKFTPQAALALIWPQAGCRWWPIHGR
jgi:predicted metal-dependent phosphoesterase TrpH